VTTGLRLSGWEDNTVSSTRAPPDGITNSGELWNITILKDGRATIKNHDFGTYLSATDDGTYFEMSSNDDELEKWEIFQVSNEKYLSQLGNLKIALKSAHKWYLSADVELAKSLD